LLKNTPSLPTGTSTVPPWRLNGETVAQLTRDKDARERRGRRIWSKSPFRLLAEESDSSAGSSENAKLVRTTKVSSPGASNSSIRQSKHNKEESAQVTSHQRHGQRCRDPARGSRHHHDERHRLNIDYRH
jgi:hypothetical protein